MHGKHFSTPRQDPKLLAATARKVIELAGQQFPGRTVGVATCLGVGYTCADPAAKLLSRLADSGTALRASSERRIGRTLTTRAGDHPAALLRLDSIEHRSPDSARVHASLFHNDNSATGWRCDAVRMGAQWILGPCKMTWKL